MRKSQKSQTKTKKPSALSVRQSRNDAKANVQKLSLLAQQSLAIVGQAQVAQHGPSKKTLAQNRKVTIVEDTLDVDESLENLGKFTNKQQLFGGSLYSKGLLRGNFEDTKAFQIESLRYLEGARHLFLRKCKTFPPELSSFKPRNKRGIWNAYGRVLYYSGESKLYICRRCYYSGFTQEVVDYRGKPVITVKGRQFVFGLNSYVEILVDRGKLLGTMHQSCFSSTYQIKDSSGRLIYKIQAPCFAPLAPFVLWCCKENFEVCMDDGVTELGRITKFWGSNVAIPELKRCLGIELTRVDDVRVKALLLGCFFLIEFQYYKWGGNGPLYFLLMLLTFAGIIIATECAGYCPFWSDRVFEQIEVL